MDLDNEELEATRKLHGLDKKNNIEEDIKDIKKYISFTSKRENFSHDTDWSWNKDLANKIEHVLSDYKRILKENEELKQDRNNNYQMIALAQNEVLGYMQGYEDGKKLKRSAVACVVENQQYYIIKKEIEHYKEYIEKLQKENEHLHREINRRIKLKIENEKIVDTQFISIQKIKDKIEELNSRIEIYRKYVEQGVETDVEWVDNVADRETVKVLQELIKEEEEN